MKRSTLAFFLVGIALFAAAMACNLTAERPPTIVPRATDTPLPTIGYATLSPTELPQQVSTPFVPSDASLINLLNQVESDRLFVHVDTLQAFGTRHINSGTGPTQGINGANNYITSQFEAIGAQSNGNLQIFPQAFEVDWAGVTTMQENIIAIINGNEVGTGAILIGAHYDSVSNDPEDGLAFAPGANDNATGVAAMLEIARIMALREHRSTIIFVAFSAEEQGRLGSIAFVREYVQAQQIPLDAVINLDIIGSQTGPNGSINDGEIRLFSAGPNDSASRHLAREINLIAFNNVPNMVVTMQDAEDRPERYSDHMSFSNVGYPAVRFIEALEESYRQHTDRDTLDDVQSSYLTDATRTVLAVTTALADGPRPPRNIGLNQNLDNTRTLTWERVPDAASYIIALRRPNSLIYQQIEVGETSVTWDRFVSTEFVALALAAKDRSGLMGPLSEEVIIP
ncbi:MAG: M20/M25/M40 family metallo-hydrolase [Burkholderiales bacterium]|nr:M20/M25/M40 family metallo-hydrolase [Anaerolineae bacterium]